VVYGLVGLAGVWVAIRATTLLGREDHRAHAIA
jgi:uncharacterized membrane protein YuzA (DUF378 family)